MNLDSLKGKKVAIDDVLTTYSSRLTSHKSAWTFLIRNQLKHVGVDAEVLTKGEDILDYDAWLIVLPMEANKEKASSLYNVFGGIKDEDADRVERLLTFKGDIFIVNDKMPRIEEFITARKKNCKSEKWSNFDVDLFANKVKSIETIDLLPESETVIFGDSHCVSTYIPGSHIIRFDSRTLGGMLMDKWIIPGRVSHVIPSHTKNLVTYFGNIDIRHHLCRQANSEKFTKNLVKMYFDKLATLNIENISVVKALPIEHEGRKIPTTGYFKGAPFFGSREQRSEICRIFNNEIEEYAAKQNIGVIRWPKEWYEMDPQEYAETIMEKPRSVHISRQYYQYDFETNQKNY